MGYILMNFFDMTEDLRLDTSSKRTFVVTPKNMDVILDLDPRTPYNNDESNEELMLYRPIDSDVMNIIKVTKNKDRSHTFTYCEMSGSEDDDDD